MITIITNASIAFALSVCGHFEASITTHYIEASAGEELALEQIKLHRYACEATMNQAYGEVVSWECIIHSEPGAEAHCIMEVIKHDS